LFAQRAAQIQRGGRPAEGNLDAQGRSAASRPQEDELEIPAFLRRQSN
jgi:cell division protein FtsZ